MYIEITGYSLSKDAVVKIYAHDISELNYQKIMRERDGGFEREICFKFDTRNNRKAWQYLNGWLHSQKSTQGSKTYGEALHAVVGTRVYLNGRYLECWDDE